MPNQAVTPDIRKAGRLPQGTELGCLRTGARLNGVHEHGARAARHRQQRAQKVICARAAALAQRLRRKRDAPISACLCRVIVAVYSVAQVAVAGTRAGSRRWYR